MRGKNPRSESFEGNAQSFRVVTRLAVRSEDFEGLDLTRATLNALLKYPWCWRNRLKPNKWGAYEEDQADYDWARDPLPDGAKLAQTIEAEIMDTADDISYAVHDLEDFYRAGLVPLDRLVRGDGGNARLTDEGEIFFAATLRRCLDRFPGTADEVRAVFEGLMANSPVSDPYRGLRGERAALRAFSSSLIGRYIQSAELDPRSPRGRRLTLPVEYRREIFILQQLTWHYVILNPALSMQQAGQTRLISSLFDFFYDAALGVEELLFPPRAREMLKPLVDGTYQGNRKKFCARLAADVVSSMTEHEAQNVAHRILGVSPGSAFEQLL